MAGKSIVTASILCALAVGSGCSQLEGGGWMGGLMSGVSVNNPRCEYLVNPSAIDTPAPRLSWEIAAPGRGVTQTAYQVLVAGSRKALDAGKGDLWDSGKLASDQCNQI